MVNSKANMFLGGLKKSIEHALSLGKSRLEIYKAICKEKKYIAPTTYFRWMRKTFGKQDQSVAVKIANKNRIKKVKKMDEAYITATREQLKKIDTELEPINKRRAVLMKEKIKLTKMLKK